MTALSTAGRGRRYDHHPATAGWRRRPKDLFQHHRGHDRGGAFGRRRLPLARRGGGQHHRGHRLVAGVGRGAASALARRAGQQPGVDEHVLRGETLLGLLFEEATDQTLGARAQRVGQVELAAADFGKKAGVLGPMEWIPGI